MDHAMHSLLTIAQADRQISLGGGFIISGVGLVFLAMLLSANTAMRRAATRSWGNIDPGTSDRKASLHRVLFATARAKWFTILIVLVFGLGILSLLVGAIVELAG